MDRTAASAAIMRANFVLGERPDRLPRALLAMQPWGASLPGSVAASAARYPHAVAVIDDAGPLTYSELWSRSNALARGLVAEGLSSGTRIGILAHNHRGFVLATLAAAKSGADVVFLNTGFGAPQLGDVVASERIDAVLHDDDFTDLIHRAGVPWALDEAGVRSLTRAFPRADVRPPRQPGAMVVLTSGTTGRPKGAARHTAGGLVGVAAILSRIPLRARGTTVDAAPLFHAWGMGHMMMALALSSTLVLRRKFDAEETLRLVEEHNARVLVVVPVMLQRMLALGPDVLVKYDTSKLRVIASSGSALGGKLAADVLNRFGPILYNVYGSTEVATATIATPDDLLAAPTTAGRVAPGVRVEVLGDGGQPVETGQTGRVFVGSPMRFEGYTTGGSKEAQRGLLSSGDLGHFDSAGRLFVEGREDDMVVTGGENVFPGEVEEILAHHPDVADVVVIGVDDEEFGKALKAFVVRRSERLDVDAVRGHVREHLARFKVPRSVVFVDELPRNATGKVLRNRLS